MLRAQTAGSDVGEIGDRLDHTRVVDQDVEAAEPLSRCGYCVLDSGIVSDVAGQRLAADLPCHLLDECTVSRHQHDLGAGLGERPGRSFAEAAARAGHQCDFSLQAHRVSSATVATITQGRKKWPARSDSSDLGAMGGPMARNLIKADVPLVVHDIDTAKTAKLNAEVAGSAKEVAAKDRTHHPDRRDDRSGAVGDRRRRRHRPERQAGPHRDLHVDHRSVRGARRWPRRSRPRASP